jgi:hypothetical protein
MSVLQVTTTQGTDTGLEDTVVEAFKASLRGALLCPAIWATKTPAKSIA